MNPEGRPTKYKPEYCQDMLDYFNIAPYTVDKSEKGRQEVPNDLPLFEGFAAHIGVHRETLINWTKEHPQFFDAYKQAKELQKKILIVNALRGNYNNTFSIFTAKNITDMRDEVVQKHEFDESIKKKLKEKFDGAFGEDT